MDDAIGIDLGVAGDDLAQVLDGFPFGHASLGGDELGEITPFAVFGDDVGVILGGVDVVHFDNVPGVLERLQHFDFGGEQTFMYFALEHAHVDHLDGNSFI